MESRVGVWDLLASPARALSRGAYARRFERVAGIHFIVKQSLEEDVVLTVVNSARTGGRSSIGCDIPNSACGG